MAKGDLLGYMDCPVCGYQAGMKVTEDKNGEPFGFCEQNCDAQLRIGGKLHRVEKFYRLHPSIKRLSATPAPVAVPVAVKADATETAKPTPPTPPAKPARKAFSLDEV